MVILITRYPIIINQLPLALHSHLSMARFHHIINMDLLGPGYSFQYGHIFPHRKLILHHICNNHFQSEHIKLAPLIPLNQIYLYYQFFKM
jgi:hypothetical protein